MANDKTKSKVFLERLFSTLLLWGVVTAVVISGNTWAFVSLIVILAFIASVELFSMAKKRPRPYQVKWGILISAIYLLFTGYLLASHGQSILDTIYKYDALFIFLCIVGGFSIQLTKPIENRLPVERVANTLLGFIYIPVFFSFMGRLLFLPDPIDGVIVLTGVWLVLWVAVVTKFTDMGAYITGSLMGKHKMIPHISPGKTWEGFFGALVFAQLAGCTMYAILPESLSIIGGWFHVVILSFLIAIIAVVGDLAESIIKRSLEIKDSGRTLPGIGGVLDLIDSICFTAPFAFFYITFILNK